MFISNCCSLTCAQVSQEAGKAVWYFYFFKNFLQFVVIHTVKDFGIVNKPEIDVFLELSCFLLGRKLKGRGCKGDPGLMRTFCVQAGSHGTGFGGCEG